MHTMVPTKILRAINIVKRLIIYSGNFHIRSAFVHCCAAHAGSHASDVLLTCSVYVPRCVSGWYGKKKEDEYGNNEYMSYFNEISERRIGATNFHRENWSSYSRSKINLSLSLWNYANYIINHSETITGRWKNRSTAALSRYGNFS